MLAAPLSISFGEKVMRLELRHWINDGLMAIFFFGVGLEIKREFLVGELAERRKAILPIVAAIGVWRVGADLCRVQHQWSRRRGWGVPMATDIAFALSALAVLGSAYRSARGLPSSRWPRPLTSVRC
ncbi:MAG: Na+/H+ antiporter NhaA [Comamonadaceae bacterium]|nr:Na+/H+ antiporter NhaA [Comamonadaceae bacterium]